MHWISELIPLLFMMELKIFVKICTYIKDEKLYTFFLAHHLESIYILGKQRMKEKLQQNI